MCEYTLDARRLLCPMPVIKTQNRVKQLNPGDTLEIICSDPGALQDIPSWCRVNGHKVLATEKQNKEVIIKIEVGNSDDRTLS